MTGLSARRLVELGVVHAAARRRPLWRPQVEEHLIVALRRLRRRDRRVRIREVYEIFPRLEARQLQRARTLSGGEKRMLSIARTLLLDGKVFLIDEPSLGLSPLMVDEVYRQIGELARRGLTLLLVEENPVRLRGLADTLYLLDRGSVVASGPTETLLTGREPARDLPRRDARDGGRHRRGDLTHGTRLDAGEPLVLSRAPFFTTASLSRPWPGRRSAVVVQALLVRREPLAGRSPASATGRVGLRQ